MYLDFALLGLVVVIFFVAFYFIRWSRETNIHMDKRESWKQTNPGGGGV